MRAPNSDLVQVVQQSKLPALLLRLSNEEVVAASEEAGRLVGVGVSGLVGHMIEDFAADDPGQVLDLVATGRITGFQSRRILLHPDGATQPIQVWLRAADLTTPVEFAIAILWPAGRAAWEYLPGPEVMERYQVIGTVDSRLEIERVSEDVRVLGLTAEEAVGGSLFRLVDVSSAADLLQGLSEATRSRQALCLAVNVHFDGVQAMAQLMIRPLEPTPSFSFSFVCPAAEWPREALMNEGNLQQMGRGLHALALAEAYVLLDQADVPGVANLSTRELDITARLLAGDRVPAIAQSLYLSQSTVRNHLARAFRKLRVSSQQELIDVFRESADRLHERDVSSSGN
jgi:DNA-binding CsgD family transcriptional regulator